MSRPELTEIATDAPVWRHFYTVSPLVVVGTEEEDGFDLAPKHMVTPLGWGNYFGFVCTPRHATYRNAREHGAFTVTFPAPEQVVVTSLTAAPRCDDGDVNPELASMETFAAEEVRGRFLQGGHAFLECELDRVVDGFGDASLVAGRIVAARVRPEAIRGPDRSDQDLLREHPVLAFLSPDRYTDVGGETHAFPYPSGFRP